MDLYGEQILAIQLSPENIDRVVTESEREVLKIRANGDANVANAIVCAPNKPMLARYGDYVIRHPNGDFGVMRAEEFRDKYEGF